MDIELNDDQQALVEAVTRVVEDHGEVPAARRRDFSYYAHDLDKALADNGFLDAAKTLGMGLLEAVLVVEAVARAPVVVEAGASAIVVPMICPELTDRPVALLSKDLSKAHRFLPVARAALYDAGDDVLVLEIDPTTVEPVETVWAYPYGRFTTLPDLKSARRLGSDAVARLRQGRQLAIAAEAAGAMRAAVDFTLEHTKNRQMFRGTLAQYQAVQHRLALDHQAARSAWFLAVKAGWSGSPLDAALAATYVQQHIPRLWFDVHQFNGAMGLTLEHRLHLWTYRLRALQGDLGGVNTSAVQAAEVLWG